MSTNIIPHLSNVDQKQNIRHKWNIIIITNIKSLSEHDENNYLFNLKDVNVLRWPICFFLWWSVEILCADQGYHRHSSKDTGRNYSTTADEWNSSPSTADKFFKTDMPERTNNKTHNQPQCHNLWTETWLHHNVCIWAAEQPKPHIENTGLDDRDWFSHLQKILFLVWKSLWNHLTK